MNQKLNNLLSPYPDGKQFSQLIKWEINTKLLPYMHPYSLNQDTVLYKAMLIILANRLGVLESHINDASKEDTLPANDRQRVVNTLVTGYQKITKFMSSEPMIALRDNEYHNQHENKDRLVCYRFLKDD